MLKSLLASLFFLLASFLPASADLTSMRQSVVEVGTLDGLGTGVIIGPNTILTAAHVVDNSDHLRIMFYGSSFELYGKATLVRKDLDLALVTIAVPKELTKAIVNCKEVVLGQSITMIGFPLGLPWVMTKGYIASDIAPNDDNQLLMDMRTNHGNSGGPVFNDKGEVIGIALAEVGQLPTKERGIGNTFGMFLPTSKFCSELNIKGN